MNELERAIRTLLAQTPTGPELQGLERRARHRRIRHASTIVVVAVAIAVATVGVAGAIDHRSSGPQIAVSPTTSTTVDTNVAECALVVLEQQKAQLAQLEKELTDQLTAELAAHSPYAGATDATHQAVLREQSDVDQRILDAQAADGGRPDLGSPAPSLNPADSGCTRTVPAATAEAEAECWSSLDAHSPNVGDTAAAHRAVLSEVSDAQQHILQLEEYTPGSGPFTCPPDAEQAAAEEADAWCQEWEFLDAQRVQLKTLEEQLNQQLTAELAAHSPNAGATDAAHQAVLREQSDVQQHILQLDERRPGSGPLCRPADESSTTTTVPTP
jgi:hypothetical protein